MISRTRRRNPRLRHWVAATRTERQIPRFSRTPSSRGARPGLDPVDSFGGSTGLPGQTLGGLWSGEQAIDFGENLCEVDLVVAGFARGGQVSPLPVAFVLE